MTEFLARGELAAIRQVTPDDYPLLYEIWHDPDVQRNLNFVDSDPFEVWLEKSSEWRSWLDCIVISPADGKPAGYVSLGWIKKDPQLVILLLPGYRGRGIGTEASRLILEYGFTTMGLTRVEAGTHHFNTACQQMLTNLGFARDPDQDESADNAWGEGQVTELCYHLDKDGYHK